MKHSYPQFRPPRFQKRLAEDLARVVEASPVFVEDDVEVVWDNWDEFSPTSYEATIVATIAEKIGNREYELDIDIGVGTWYARLIMMEPIGDGGLRGYRQVGSVVIDDIHPEALPGKVSEVMGVIRS